MKNKSLVFFLVRGTRIPKFISLQNLNVVKKTEKKFIILKIKKADLGPVPAYLLVKMPGSSSSHVAFNFSKVLKVEDVQKHILWKNWYYCKTCQANSAYLIDTEWKNGKRRAGCNHCGNEWEVQRSI